jgi:tetratricopeptide (TPR) repeat protein
MSGARALSLAVLFALLLFPATPFASPDDKVPVTTASKDAKLAFLKGRDLFEKLRVADARTEFERATQLDPAFGQALLGLANTQPTTRAFNEVIARAAATVDRVSPGEKLMILAGVAGGHGDNAEQIRLLKELVALHPKDERAHTLYGNALFGTQQWAEAVKAFEVSTRINPSFSQPYNQLGYSYRFLGKNDKAEPVFKKYIELIPDDPNPYDSYAELLLKLGRFEESIAMYRKALAVDPTFIASHIGIATGYDLLQRPEDARKELDTLLGIAKDDGQRRAALFARTVSWAHAGDLAAAQKDVERQYELGVASGDTLAMAGDWVLMGTLALEQGDAAAADREFANARDLIEKAANIPPANRANQRRFQKFLQGRVALARNDVDGAKKWSDDFAAEANASGSAGQKRLVHELAGQVALAEKDYTKAIAELTQANQQDPYNLYRLSLAYAGAGKTEKAKEYAALARGDNALTNINYAFVRRAMNGRKDI